MQARHRWNIAEPDSTGAAELASSLGTSPVLAQILLNRGLSDPEACRQFLRPTLKSLHDPALIPNLDRAAERIAAAIRQHEPIAIYGDYDVDGITATAILWHAIRLLGGKPRYYIPHRIDEGYGLNPDAITQLADQGARVIITVDCGITAIEPARVARERGVDLIITDHHDWKQQPGADGISRPVLPDCHTIVHPRLPPEHTPAYPNGHLCGAGVAFKLAWGIGLAASGGAARVNPDFRQFLVDATALAALGTIADVVPLVGENRILAHFGLLGLRQTGLCGLKALVESTRLTGQALDSYHVGFLLAPRLNACGRMGHAALAVEMLTDADPTRAAEIAAFLEQQNRQRQATERTILDEALEQVAQLKIDDDCRAIVLAGEGWHAGVIGIVASRIVDRLGRPTIMIAVNDGAGQGSGRSIAGFHLADALQACSQHLLTHGGHGMAAGLAIDPTHIDAFRQAFQAHAAQRLTPDQLVPELRLDVAASLNQVTQALVADLQRLGPFGHGNRKPLLLCRSVELTAPPRRVGKTGDHLQLQIRQGSSFMKCIAFNHGRLFDRLTPGSRVDLAVEPIINEFRGSISVELQVKDLQAAR
jgi:single-stranded-DNA-specific exonuclease